MGFFRHPSLIGNLIIVSIAILIWSVYAVTLMRWIMRRSMAAMQSRLETWAAEGGYKIIQQERPAEAPLSRRVRVWGPFFWAFSLEPPWVLDVQVRPFEGNLPILSTCVILEDREGHLRRGRMRYIGASFGGFWSSVESRWEEETDEDRPPPRSKPPATRDDPLWDHWADTPGAR